MEHQRSPRSARQDLALRLVLEYAGAVPAGQVMAAVVRADRLLRARNLTPPQRIEACEDLVRHRLAECTAELGRRRQAATAP